MSGWKTQRFYFSNMRRISPTLCYFFLSPCRSGFFFVHGNSGIHETTPWIEQFYFHGRFNVEFVVSFTVYGIKLFNDNKLGSNVFLLQIKLGRFVGF